MKVSRNLFSITLASLLLAATAFASPSKGTLKLFEPVTVQGKQLAPGKYTVEWNGEGPNVSVEHRRRKRTPCPRFLPALCPLTRRIEPAVMPPQNNKMAGAS